MHPQWSYFISTEEHNMHDLIIIGGGPAALAAAVYAMGKQLDIMVIYEKQGGKAGTQQHLHGQAGAVATPGIETARLLERESPHSRSVRFATAFPACPQSKRAFRSPPRIMATTRAEQ